MKVQDRSDVIEVRLGPEQLRALDSWRVRHREAATREDAIRQIVHSVLSQDLGQGAVRGQVDEGLRPEQLTSENDD
ncbi:hypothetical protein [Microvirga pudoricolor]|uniref:hypothetical protein n=1 Tax=Microvirga pudoricolor TaxID=2778729 RepID=UPI0019508EAE|nr:hypothetical protein [Microvirga pudoricolor]MBM6593232.1 hypothetical protein [Microvirga pudoricolor]